MVVVQAGGATVLLLCFWLLLVDGAPPSELGAGLLVAVLAAAVGVAAARSAGVRFRPRWEWLADAAWLLPGLIADTWVVLRALPRTLHGGRMDSRYVAFQRPVAAADARTCARRALLVAWAGFTPNTIVVSFDEDAVMVHQLVPRPGLRVERL